MKPLRAFVFLLVFSVAALAADSDDVRTAFDNYKAAVLAQEGERAAALVSKRTIAEYEQYLDWALTADKPTLEWLSMINRFQVILFRHRIPVADLRSLDGRRAFVYAVDRDWIGKNGVIRLSLGEVDVAGNRATAETIVGKRRAPNRFQFIKEDGAWRLDLVPTIRDSNTALAEVAKRKGVSEDQLIFELTETVSGKKVPETIWEPVGRSASGGK